MQERNPTRDLLMLLACRALAAQSFAGGLDQLSNRDASAGLKDALLQGTGAAVSKLGIENGFFGNEKVRIPLPGTLRRVESGLRLLGHEARSRRAGGRHEPRRGAGSAGSEGATYQRRAQHDAQGREGISSGDETARTEHSRRVTREPLAKKFLPIVTAATRKVALAEKYSGITSEEWHPWAC